MVCFHWHDRAEDHRHWERLSKQTWSDVVPPDRAQSWKTHFEERLNWQSGRCVVTTLKGHTAPVLCVTRYSREGRLVVSGSADATARLWDANRASSIELKGHTRAVSSVAASASLISTASEDGTVKLWSPETGQCIGTLSGHAGPVRRVRFAGPNFLLSASVDETFKIWDLSTQKVLHEIPCVPRNLLYLSTREVRDPHATSSQVDVQYAFAGSATFSGYSLWAQTLSFNNVTVARDVRRGGLRPWKLHGYTEEVGHLGAISCISMDDMTAITGHANNTIHVWRISNGALLNTLYGHTAAITALQHDYFKIISASRDRTLKVWDRATGDYLYTLTGHNKEVTCVELHPKFLLSGSADCNVKMWDFSSEARMNYSPCSHKRRRGGSENDAE